MAIHEAKHAKCVDAWMRGASDLSSRQLIALLELALDKIWQRALRTLGEVTLTAIADRVLYTASETYPFLVRLTVTESGIVFTELRKRGDIPPDAGEVYKAVRYVLIDLLRVLGNMTADILTNALHAELAQIEYDASGLSEPPPDSGPSSIPKPSSGETS